MNHRQLHRCALSLLAMPIAFTLRAGDVAPDVTKKIKAQIAEIGIPGPGAPPDLLG